MRSSKTSWRREMSLGLIFSISSFNIHTVIAYTKEALLDQVISLPGASEGDFYSNQFSGFLDISSASSGTKSIHYIYYESENDPDNDPVVFWTNGGPGCSGLLGLFTEFGPWRPTGNETIIRNPASWSTIASLVFLEQPAGVGFSRHNYGASSSDADASGSYSWNDFRAATDNFRTIKAFFEKFPERDTNDFYIASESYGGHYIPQLAMEILNGKNKDYDKNIRERFVGLLVGNPFTSFNSGMIAMLNVMWGLQVLPAPTWKQFTAAGCDVFTSNPYEYTDECWDLAEELYDHVYALNPYALDYPVCTNDDAAAAAHATATSSHQMSRHGVFMSQGTSAQARYHAKMMKRFSDLMKSKKMNKIGKRTGGVSSSSSSSSSSRSGRGGSGRTDGGSLREFNEGSSTSSSKRVVTNEEILAVVHATSHSFPSTTTTSSSSTTTSSSSASAFFSTTSTAIVKREADTSSSTSAVSHSAAASSSSSSSSSSTTRSPHDVTRSLPYDACAQSYLTQYLNNPHVQKALHVLPIQTTTDGDGDGDGGVVKTVNWDWCTDDVNYNWQLSDYYADTTPLYSLIYNHKNAVPGFKMLVYSGDSDSVCATIGTQNWIYNIAGTSVQQLFTPWTYTSEVYGTQQGGMHVRFNDSASSASSSSSSSSMDGTSTKLMFATVHYAGHEAPAYQPEASLELFKNYLSGSLYNIST